jgi:hypothetical protein
MSIADDPLYQESFVETADGGRRFSIEKYDRLKAAQQAKNPARRPVPEGAVKRAI